MIEILITHGNGILCAGTHQFAEQIWRTFFKIDIIKYENYAIMTDGVSVSVRLIHPIRKQKKDQEYENKKKGMERRKKGEPKPEKKKNIERPISAVKSSEFSYMDDVPKQSLKGRHLLMDPGKYSLLSSIGEETDEIVKYTNRQSVWFTKKNWKYVVPNKE